MSFSPADFLGPASRSAFRAEVNAGMDGNVAMVCFIACSVMLGAAFYTLGRLYAEGLFKDDESPSR